MGVTFPTFERKSLSPLLSLSMLPKVTSCFRIIRILPETRKYISGNLSLIFNNVYQELKLSTLYVSKFPKLNESKTIVYIFWLLIKWRCRRYFGFIFHAISVISIGDVPPLIVEKYEMTLSG